MKAFRCSGIPAAFLINHLGQVVWNGHPGNSELDSAVEDALKALDQHRSLDVTGKTRQDLMAMRANDLKRILAFAHVDYRGLSEKPELVDAILRHQQSH